MNNASARQAKRTPFAFFLLVFALSVPFWLVGAATGIQLLPGLPVAALGALCPALAAAIIVGRETGRKGIAALLARSFDIPRAKATWLLPALVLVPAVMTLTYVLMRVAGEPVPPLQVSLSAALFMLLAFFANALFEELGWSGYALDPLQARFGALNAALLVGVVWAVWHFVPLLQAHRTPAWIAWWTLGTISMRVIMVWLYNNSERSVLAVAVFHAMSNLGFFLVPGFATTYDPRIVGILLTAIAVATMQNYSRRAAEVPRKEIHRD